MKDSKYEILIADDSELSQKIIAETLNAVGDKIELYFALDGVKACDMALEILPDLIIMDIIMPERNGIDSIKYMREREETNSIPIIV